MILRHIDILNFKNLREAQLDFTPGVNCLLGLNGMGKSNLLEAIHFLSMARPMRAVAESALILHGEDMLMVKGDYLMDSGAEERVSCGIVRGKGKTLRRNDKDYRRISEHIGRFPIVTVSPPDSEIVTGGGDVRRRLMDVVISQADDTYLNHLIRYSRGLESRNKMLRAGVRDKLLYESVEQVMAESGEIVNAGRRKWVKEIAPDFAAYYSRISGDAETAGLKYNSVLNDKNFREVFESERGRDLALGFTSSGVHRDDLSTRLGDYSMKRLGSQGQVKTFTIALRLAIFGYLKRRGGVTPILLLDDIFDKLDAERVARIMAEVSGSDNFGQIFITDTNREHLDETLAGIRSESKLFEVSNGSFKQL
ncbi:MAG: DNA replication and repair protein RecF [Candidatus Amulumruptor caecigallinarius]|nr:DNA replication and repair protein RecF [Candidatus Amulumruptor caecigallinarius]